jgi:nicotinamide-nucleotide amidase
VSSPPARRILTAELLSIGTELTVGETRDTNAGELAAALTGAGVVVGRITALPDRLDVVTDAFAGALERVDLVVSTGGLGPTPDDLTREAIAAVMGETPVVDPELEAWLRALWARRDAPFPPANIKQAWRIPSARSLPNPNGTAPGWLVTRRSDGRVVVALPGPPREMRPMWGDHVLPALGAQGLGAELVSRTFRLTGVGESQVAEILGDELLRRPNPEVATYARAEAVDVRVSAVADDDADAASHVARASAVVLERLGDHVWTEGATTWSEAIGAALTAHDWRLAVVEIGTGGQVAALLGDAPWLAIDESIAPDGPAAGPDDAATDVAHARRAMATSGAEIGLAVRTRDRGGDLAVRIVVVSPDDEHVERRLAFLSGRQGRSRAALHAAAVLLARLRMAGTPEAASP